MNKEYKIVNGMSFDMRTHMFVCGLLSNANRLDSRLRLFYGDSETGKDWMEEYDTIGYIGRSTGSIKIPLLIKTKRSTGGPAILDHCIVKITQNGNTVYQHPKYHLPEISIDGCAVYTDGTIWANCKSSEQANRLAKFIKGERNSK